ncbi:Ig-like domain-containing protein, partial [Xanthomonas citri pv. citri]
DVSGIAAGTAVSLYFDLLGFGASTSAATISDVHFIGEGANTAPVAGKVTADVQETDPATAITASFVDPDANDTFTFAIDTTTDHTKGIVINNGDGTFSYDPNGAFASLKAGATATDQFRYTVTDAAGESSTALVVITIHGENQAPSAAPVSANAQE